MYSGSFYSVVLLYNTIKLNWQIVIRYAVFSADKETSVEMFLKKVSSDVESFYYLFLFQKLILKCHYS